MTAKMRPLIHHVVFDIGNVLIRFDPAKPFAQLIVNDDRRDFFLNHICNAAWNLEQDRGRPWPEGEALLIGQFPEFETEIRQYRMHFQEMVSEVLVANVDIMISLIDSGVDVTILTNAAGDTLRETMKILDFLSVPRGITISGDIGTVKPDRRIYDLHAKNYSLETNKTLFIDDKVENIEAAKKCGWHGVLLANQTDLKQELENFEIRSRI